MWMIFLGLFLITLSVTIPVVASLWWERDERMTEEPFIDDFPDYL